jgi:hypothetical protein
MSTVTLVPTPGSVKASLGERSWPPEASTENLVSAHGRDQYGAVDRRVLVLLAIFIVKAPLLTNAAKLDLPKATSNADIQKPKVEFAIDATGSLFWNGERLSREDAVAKFTEAGTRRPQPEIYLRADQNVAYRCVA